MSRPVAEFLVTIGEPLADPIRDVLNSRDDVWKYWVIRRLLGRDRLLLELVLPDLERIAASPTNGEREEGVTDAIVELLNALEPRRSILHRLTVAGSDPRAGRTLADELADELVTPTLDGASPPEDDAILDVLDLVIREDAGSAPAGIGADALAIAGHRRGMLRSDRIDRILMDGVERLVARSASTVAAAPLVNALAELSATRPIPVAVPVVLSLLDLARAESDPSLMAMDGALTVLRLAVGPEWQRALRARWAGLPLSPPIEEAIRLAADSGGQPPEPQR